MTHHFWICKNDKIQVQPTFEKCKITNLPSWIINIFTYYLICCWYTWCIFYILVIFVDTLDELNNTWYISLVWYTWYVVDTFVKLCKYTQSIKYIDALSIIRLLYRQYISYDLFIHLMSLIHYKFDTLNTLVVNILYFTNILDKFNIFDIDHMFDTLDVLSHFLCLLIHSID